MGRYTRAAAACVVAGLCGAVSAVDVDAALNAARKPKKDLDKAEVSSSAKDAQSDMQRRIDAIEQERKRRRDDLLRPPPADTRSYGGLKRVHRLEATGAWSVECRDDTRGLINSRDRYDSQWCGSINNPGGRHACAATVVETASAMCQ